MNVWFLVQDALILAATTFLGVLTADILTSTKYVDKVAFLFVPLMKIAKLPRKLSLPALISIIDSRAEQSIVSSYLNRSEVREAEVLVYNLVTSPLSLIMFFFKYYLPIVIASLGLYLGGMYVLFSLLSSLTGLTIGVVYGRLRLKGGGAEEKDVKEEGRGNRAGVRRVNLRRSVKSAASFTKTILQKYLIILVALLVLDYLGVFSSMKFALQAAKVPLSPQALTIFTATALRPTAGVLMSGELVKSGSIGAKEVLLALVLGRFTFLITQDYPRGAFPLYASIYPTKTAAKLLALLVLQTTLSTPLCILIILYLL